MRERTVWGKGWTAELQRYDGAAVERRLAPLLEYWLGERGARPQTSSANKCRACPLNAAGLCEYALAPADSRFTVERTTDGKVLVLR
jgi:hypothetical protein